MITGKNLTPRSLEVFLLYAEDAEHWGGEPYVTLSNVNFTNDMRGNLSDLVQKKLITIHSLGTTDKDDPTFNNDTYIKFTQAGRTLAAYNGVNVSYWD